MTFRQRPNTGNATVTVSPANGTEGGAERTHSFSWEDWFHHASSQQRADALGLAHRQGLVYPHQLPAVANGVVPSENGKDTETAQLLRRLFAGKVDGFPVLARETIQLFDTGLDELQAEAVARAIASPDLFLLAGHAGTGKSRVLSEIIRQASVRGWRTLLLAYHPEALDAALAPIADRAECFTLRYLDASEKADRLPEWVRRLTPEEQKRSFRDRLLSGARSRQVEAEGICQRFQHDETRWAELPALRARCQATAEKLRELRRQSADLEAFLGDPSRGDEASRFAAELPADPTAKDEALAALDKTLQEQTAALTLRDAELADLTARIAALEPAYQAKKNASILSPAFWSNLFNSSVLTEMEILVQNRSTTEANRQTLSASIAAIQAQRDERALALERECKERLAADGARRIESLNREIAQAEAAQREAEAAWSACVAPLHCVGLEKTDASVADARELWQRQKQQNEQQCKFAQQWTRFVEDGVAALAEKLPDLANVVAATISRWHADVKFQSAFAGPIDLVIIEDAELHTEAEMLKLTRHARRVVVVGTPESDESAPPTEKPRTLTALAPRAWGKLWHAVREPIRGQASCSWRRREGRLVCQLQHLGPDDHHHLETECLADSPDIELSILHRPRSRPSLAQMVFAPRYPFAEAFLFMTREVEEFPLQPLGRTAWWTEDDRHIRRCFGLSTNEIHQWIELEDGLRLALGLEDCDHVSRVISIEFNRESGWNRERIESWLQRHRAGSDNERCVVLQTPYRHTVELAHALYGLATHDLLTAGLRRGQSESAAFEFIPVPAQDRTDWPTEGAGLEQDLSAPRHSDKLPSMLRAGLPNRGYANLLEAQAVIRRLESIMQKEPAGATAVRIAVVAMYEGQGELIRKLIDQSAVLRPRLPSIEIGVPSRWRQRDADIVVLSLTRSHAHRAVPFGDAADDLPLALTRARSRLIILGDPGSLSKRARTAGSTDPRDIAESALLAKLLDLVQPTRKPDRASNGKPVLV